MIEWFMGNLGTIIISALLILMVVCIIRVMIRDKKAGKHSCGGKCGACGGCSHSCGTGGNKPTE